MILLVLALAFASYGSAALRPHPGELLAENFLGLEHYGITSGQAGPISAMLLNYTIIMIQNSASKDFQLTYKGCSLGSYRDRGEPQTYIRSDSTSFYDMESLPRPNIPGVSCVTQYATEDRQFYFSIFVNEPHFLEDATSRAPNLRKHFCESTNLFAKSSPNLRVTLEFRPLFKIIRDVTTFTIHEKESSPLLMNAGDGFRSSRQSRRVRRTHNGGALNAIVKG